MQNSDTVQIKITANSADEAVKVIKERFGDQANVLKVQQAESGGLKRLMGKPRLEVFVSVPKSALSNDGRKAPAARPEPVAPEATASVSNVPVKPEVANAASESVSSEKSASPGQSPERAKPQAGPVSKAYSKANSASYFESLDEEIPTAIPSVEADLGSAANPVRRGTLDAVSRGISMLKSVGFDDGLIERIRYDIDFKKVGERQTMDLYGLICDWLRNNYPNTKDAPRGMRRAFIGSSSSGKTSALCKSLSADIFVNGVEPNVMKVDSDVPNCSDALEAFCDIMGRSLARSFDEVDEISEEHPLYLDLPGFSLTDMEKVSEYKEMLDRMEVDERVLVINAAYDSDVIGATFDIGHQIGAQYVVFTHLDETIKTGKLWKYALSNRIKPLFFSNGANPAGDYTFDSFSYLLERSFPHGRSIMSSSKSSSANEEAVNLEKEELVS